MISDTVKDIIALLSEYPLQDACFRDYVSWILRNDTEKQDDYVLINILREKNLETLQRVEASLAKSRTILNISTDEFVRVFEFRHDLLTKDPEKLHDLMAEPLFVVDLDNLGFTSIVKLPRFIGTAANKRPNADFVASFSGQKYAIELKTIRMENKPKPEFGKLLGNGTKPYWWGEMFRSNAITKIEDKERRVLKQLANAKTHYQCAKTMLGLYTRRLGTSTLMTNDNYTEELAQLHGRFLDVDHFFCKDYFGAVSVFPPL